MAQTEIIYGMHAVSAAVRTDAENIEQIWMEHQRKDARAQELLKLAKQSGLKIEKTSRDELDRLTQGQRHQGVAASVRATSARDEAYLWKLLEQLDKPPLLLILDGVQDPHNLGACLRTADAAGVNAVIAPKDRACGLTSTVRKVACGAVESIPFIQVTNLARCLEQLKQRNIWLVGTDLETEQTPYTVDLKGPLAIIMGAEEKGMRRLTREACDMLVKFPMLGSVQSLNVSVSTGIILYEALRQRL